MRTILSIFGLTVFLLLGLSLPCFSQVKIDTVQYRQGVERNYLTRTLSYHQRIKRKQIDSIKVFFFSGDELRITAKSKRSVSLILSDSTNKTILASSIGSDPSTFAIKVKNDGYYTFYFSNASLFFASRIEVQLNQTHINEQCTLICEEFELQDRVSALPEKIVTTVSSKQPKDFYLALAPLDTLTLFIPGGAKIPRIDITNKENQRLFTLESQRGPFTLNLPVLDSGLVTLSLSKSGILGRIPTEHTLFLGKITPRQANDNCCNALRLIEIAPVAQVIDTLMQVRLDTLVSMVAMRDITDRPTYALELNAFGRDSSLVKRFILIDRTNNDSLITNSLYTLKERLNPYYNDKLFPTTLSRLTDKSSNAQIVFETTSQKLEIPKQLAIIDGTKLTDLDRPLVTHSNKIQSMPFRLLIVDFNFGYNLVYPDKKPN